MVPCRGSSVITTDSIGGLSGLNKGLLPASLSRRTEIYFARIICPATRKRGDDCSNGGFQFPVSDLLCSMPEAKAFLRDTSTGRADGFRNPKNARRRFGCVLHFSLINWGRFTRVKSSETMFNTHRIADRSRINSVISVNRFCRADGGPPRGGYPVPERESDPMDPARHSADN